MRRRDRCEWHLLAQSMSKGSISRSTPSTSLVDSSTRGKTTANRSKSQRRRNRSLQRRKPKSSLRSRNVRRQRKLRI